ncbi:repeatdomain containing protein [Pyrenophora tritici-repentis]|nr:DUF3295 multi-domain protein [Pyrenophora tritici-repentis]KAI1533453.1 repeatdomain containing protein [Pyrenophora tritici-repentis]
MPNPFTSVISDDSYLETPITKTFQTDLSADPPDLHRHDSATSQARGKHMTPIGLEKVFNSIQNNKFIKPLSTLPAQLAPPVAEQKPVQDNTTSVRSSTSLNPTPVLGRTFNFIINPLSARTNDSKKTQPAFTLGGSSEEENGSSSEAYSPQLSSLSQQMRKTAPMYKNTCFRNEVEVVAIQNFSESCNTAIESDSDEDDIDENAIRKEDSDDDWEDDNEESDPPSVVEHGTPFPRFKPQVKLTSRYSLLTTALHQDNGASAPQNATSQPSPAIRRSRTHTFNGPYPGSSRHKNSDLMMREQASCPKPINMITSDIHASVLSHKTMQSNMLTSELSGELKQSLLFEWQQMNATFDAVAKRRQSAVNPPALRRVITTGPAKGPNTNNELESPYNQFFDGGYHGSGW